MLLKRLASHFLIVILIISGLLVPLNFSVDSTTTGGNKIYVGSTSTFKTIQAAVDAASPGDIIYVANGTYFEATKINKTSLTLIGNSSTDCKIIYYFDGSDENNNFSSAFNVSASGVYITGFNITTTGNYSYGIYISSTNSHIIGNSITTSGHNCYGFKIVNSKDIYLANCTVITSGSNSHAIYIDGSNSTIFNHTLLTSNSIDLKIINHGNATAIDCNFIDLDVESDTGGILIIKNYLTLQAYYEDNIRPLMDAEVLIKSDEYIEYSTAGYGGTDAVLPANGRLGPILIQDRWYFYNNVPMENVTNITISKTVDHRWEDNRIVNMSESHTEIFTASDIEAPGIPSGLTVSRVPGKNALNITWYLMPDTVMYTLHRPSCQDTFFRNISHPQNWTIHQNLVDDLWYSYAIQAWDKVGLASNISDPPVDFFLSDITKPMIPTGLTATPVIADDAINISWQLNIDDTVSYDLCWAEDGTDDYQQLSNLSHPNNYTIWSDPVLKNGSSYNLKIRAWDKVYLPSEFSTPISVIHRDFVPPIAPTNLVAKPVSESKINLTWTRSSSNDVVKYNIYVNQPGADFTGPFILKTQVNSEKSQYIVTGLNEYTQYHFTISAVDEAENPSIYSNVATATTIRVPPSIPSMDNLVQYTNLKDLEITGQCEPNTTVLIFNNNLEVANGTSNETGSFLISIILTEGPNYIKARTRDNSNILSDNFSEIQLVYLDSEDPIANAGPDIDLEAGGTAEFDGSKSSDNYELGNYTWTFVDHEESLITLYGKTAVYKFIVSGNYYITLKVTDLAGNFAFDKLWVNVTTPVIIQRPWITQTVPDNQSVNVSVNTIVNIEFSHPMNSILVNSSFSIVPVLNTSISWKKNNTLMKIAFLKPMAYETTYTITLDNRARGEAGGKLINGTFILVFTTSEEPISPPSPEIDITYPLSGSTFKAGETVKVTGTSKYLGSGTSVIALIEDLGGTGQIKSDGTWEVSIIIPAEPGNYIIEVTAGEAHNSVTIIVIPAEKIDDNEGNDEENEIDLGSLFYIIPIIVIIIIIIMVLVLLLKRRKSRKGTGQDVVDVKDETEPSGGSDLLNKVLEQKAQAETFTAQDGTEPAYTQLETRTDTTISTVHTVPYERKAEESVKSEPEREVETFECPDCGATLRADDKICSKCGAEFEDEGDDDEDEQHEEKRAEVKEDRTELDDVEVGEDLYECPDCGASLGEDDTICSNCGAEFE